MQTNYWDTHREELTMHMQNLADLFMGHKDVEVAVHGHSISFSSVFVNMAYVDAKREVTLTELNRYRFLFKHTVSFLPDGKYEKRDSAEAVSGGLSLNKMSFGKSFFRGKIDYRGWCTVIGRNFETGEMGPIYMEWNTEDIKSPVKRYMESTNITEKTPFLTVKRIAAIFALGWGLIIALGLILWLAIG